MNKKVLLVHPEISRTKYNFAGVIDNEPLELEYIFALLKKEGFAPFIWDGQVEKEPFINKLHEIEPFAVYICGRTRQENFMKEYCLAAKDMNCITIVGGLHVQLNYRRFFCSYIDYVVTSFDIFNIVNILNDIEPENSICIQKNGKWTVKEAVPFDINRLPLADRSYYYEHTDRYRYLELLPCAHIRTSYSCPYKCSFCCRSKMNCGKYSARDIDNVVDEIAEINCDNIYIIDDDFLFDRKRIERFINLIRLRGIKKKFVCYGRADFIAANADLMQELKDIGVYYILTGLEAADGKRLKNYNKKTGMKTNAEAVRILNEVGINIMGMFIVDLDFTAKDFRSIYKWIKRHKVRHTAISIFTPEMSSELYEQYRGRLITDDPSHWDYLHVVAKPEKMSVRNYYMYYHILVVKLFLKGKREGIYDFLDYGYYIKSMLKNLFKFGG
ncbi:B12-binding domain-containing radical SAM protein [Ruminococcus flavefaciens]|uniref:B12-binding domain-containing radical SAM protein n=1 Tax=Ruminococcus flavefaciens TaxID=1265 RepID=UPI00031A5766|nr:B12-binding domain-containing radical SAM protein [Ruminococcus flavefaciens]